MSPSETYPKISLLILGTPKHVPITMPAPRIPQAKGSTTVLPKPAPPDFFSFRFLLESSKELYEIFELELLNFLPSSFGLF